MIALAALGWILALLVGSSLTMIYPALVREALSVREALRRAWRLTIKHRWKLGVLYFAVCLIGVLLGGLIATPLEQLYSATGVEALGSSVRTIAGLPSTLMILIGTQLIAAGYYHAQTNHEATTGLMSRRERNHPS